MDCESIQRQVLQRATLGDDARAHLQGCEACRAFAAVAGAVQAPAAQRVAPDAASLAATLAAIDADRGVAARLRAWPSSRRMLVAVLGSVAVPLLVALGTPRPDLAAYPTARLLLELGGFVLAIAIGLLWAMRPLHRALRRGAGPLTWAAAFAIAAIVAMLPTAPHGHADVGVGAQLWPRALACLAFGTVCAVPSLLLLRMLARDGDAPGWRALVLAGVAAATGTVSVFLHCPIVAHEHLWLGHVTVLVPLSLWAAFAMRPRAAA
ncbi:MAG: hypothetical protein K1X88_29035 [Nannocystaceae bacterium]|nr:hypothetical protein [Nannocystaceae bacterium]